MATAAVAMAALWVGLAHRGTQDHAVLHAPKLPTAAAAGASGDRFDWPAGVPRGPQIVQFVPGGRFTFEDA
jgi:hypothetical protein